jgi:tetratricopeptide (TPR) repeat protein
MRKKAWADAAAIIQKSLMVKSDNPAAYMLIGQAYISDKQYDQAITMLKKSVAINPEIVIAWIQLAKAYSLVEKYDDAKKILQKLTLGDKRLGLIHFRMADILVKQGKFNQAVLEFEAGLLHSEKLIEQYPKLLDISQSSQEPEDKVSAFQEILYQVKTDLGGSLDNYEEHFMEEVVGDDE